MFISDKFFYGVVEDRHDPLMIGRLKVRIFAIHSPLKVSSLTEGSSTEDLLWCHVMTPVTSASVSGVGHSPTGIVEGSHVMGVFRDYMSQDGIIMGTIPGIPTVECKPDVGFNDPNGQYPRYINAPDTNTLARGGVVPPLPSVGGNIQPTPESKKPVTVEEQDLNRDEAIEADKTPVDDIEPSPIAGMTIEEMLRRDEGVRVSVYWDHLGYPTIGIGHLILFKKTKNSAEINKALSEQIGRKVTDGRITDQEVSVLFAKDVAKVKSDIVRNAKVGPVYATLDDCRKMAIENMSFQMGVGGVAKFNQMLIALARKEWAAAQRAMLDSTWAKQTPGRANRVSKIILNGNLASYGVVNSKTRDQSEDNAMFKEPASPYAAKYPYNHVYESESGHIQEFDDTAGSERYMRRHPSGTFEEIHPDGTRVIKIIGEDFEIVKSNRNVKISGNLNIIIEGDSQLYCMGNMDATVDGSVTQLVRGNVTEQIDGNVTQTINGNSTQHVLGNVDQTIDGNATQQIQGTVAQSITGDVTQQLSANLGQTVAGNYSLQVDGNYDVTVSGNITSNASGTNKVTGNGAYVELNNNATLSGSVVNIN
ncbi:MAG: glycoside hydrolase family protein [Bacilli bacterium]